MSKIDGVTWFLVYDRREKSAGYDEERDAVAFDTLDGALRGMARFQRDRQQFEGAYQGAFIFDSETGETLIRMTWEK